MKVLALNGSPRERWNTATLLEKALGGCHLFIREGSDELPDLSWSEQLLGEEDDRFGL